MTVGILKKAIEECELSTYKLALGAVIFKGNRILSSGHNELRSSSISNKYKKYKNSLHAEQAAVMNINWKKLKGASILVIKLSKVQKKLSNAKPCDMCLQLLKTIGIKKIYYSNQFGEIVKLEEKII